MKKDTLQMIVLLAVVSVGIAGIAFSMQKSNQTSQTANKKTTSSQTSSSQVNTSSSTSSSTASSEEPTQTTPVTTMDSQAILKGDYISIIGTWQNKKGETLTFNTLGLTNGYSIVPNSGQTMGQLATLSISADNAAGNGAILFLIPKEITLGAEHLDGTEDVSDTGKDRMILSQQSAWNAETLTDSVFYRVSLSATDTVDPLTNNNTGLMLESGQVTIDYAISILGDRKWTVLESNYNRTETIPFELLQGDDQSLYRIYQNGVIVAESTNQIVYQP